MNINRNNYETYFLLYLDRELDQAEMETVEKFLAENTDLKKEFSLLQQTVQVPANIIFEPKGSLFRREEKRRIIPLYWMRIAAAVAILVAGSFFLTDQLARHRTAGQQEITGVTTHAGLKKNASNATRAIENGNADHASTPAVASVGTNSEAVQQSEPLHQMKGFNQQGQTIAAIQKQPVAAVKPSPELPPSSSESGSSEIVSVRQKPNDAALTLEPVGVKDGEGPEPMIIRPATDATALVLVTSAKEEQTGNKVSAIQDSGFQSENAISVLALNDKNKNITGFFKN